jgi:hypothetical protein
MAFGNQHYRDHQAAHFRVPLAGGFGWTRTGAAVDLHRISAIELHADTWEGGFTMDLDGVRFTKLFDACTGTPPTITPSATARATTAKVTYPAVSGAVGYDIYRMPTGGASVYVNRARGTSCGSNGFFAGDDSYAFTLTTAEGLLNWTTRHGGADAGQTVAGSQFRTRTVGTTTIMEAKIPRTGLGQGYGWTGSTTNGFWTAVGSVLGLRITFTNFGTGDQFNEPWATQNEYFHFDDVTLR